MKKRIFKILTAMFSMLMLAACAPITEKIELVTEDNSKTQEDDSSADDNTADDSATDNSSADDNSTGDNTEGDNSTGDSNSADDITGGGNTEAGSNTVEDSTEDSSSTEEESTAGSSAAILDETVSLSDELKAAVCNALINQCGSDYSAADYVIPAFSILDIDNETDGDVMVWGDFWRFAYRLEGETLVSVAGEDVSGCMHLQKQDGAYQCIGIEMPTVGSTKEQTGKTIFGDGYKPLMHLRENYGRQEETRAQIIADYVSAYRVSATKYTDYSWEPTELPSPSPDKNNIFIYMLREAGNEEEQDIVVSPATETIPETAAAKEAATDSYIVKRGDTLGSIARKHGISSMELANMNSEVILRCAREQGVKSDDLMKCANYIYPGEVLQVPAD